MLKSLLALVKGGVLSKLFIFLIGSVIARVGIGVALYVGFDEVLSLIMSDVQSLFGALPPLVLNVLGLMHVDILINTVLSAYSTAVIVVSLRKFRIL